MKYNNIQELDARVEKIITDNVKYYYTDWKNYDRIKYMKLKGLAATALLLVRDSGTYIFNMDNVKDNVIVDYFTSQEIGKFYLIDTKKYTVKRIKPEVVKAWI